MNIVNTNDSIKELINNNEMLLLYFGGNNCNVCTAMKPKVEVLLKEFPKICSAQVDVEKSIEIAAAYNIFTIPVILVYIEGKEIIREARHISIQDIHDRIERYYSMLF
jgi:thioredoxin-like negative regulator of GroEL